jgi:hypothetical protein
MHCDRSDYDRVDAFPKDWEEVEEVRSFEEATREVAIDDQTRSVFDWQTHLGVCPECQQIHGL